MIVSLYCASTLKAQLWNDADPAKSTASAYAQAAAAYAASTAGGLETPHALQMLEADSAKPHRTLSFSTLQQPIKSALKQSNSEHQVIPQGGEKHSGGEGADPITNSDSLEKFHATVKAAYVNIALLLDDGFARGVMKEHAILFSTAVQCTCTDLTLFVWITVAISC
jgi:hypothetical protein